MVWVIPRNWLYRRGSQGRLGFRIGRTVKLKKYLLTIYTTLSSGKRFFFLNSTACGYWVFGDQRVNLKRGYYKIILYLLNLFLNTSLTLIKLFWRNIKPFVNDYSILQIISTWKHQSTVKSVVKIPINLRLQNYSTLPCLF